MATKDEYVYFDVYARGEAVRMLYAVAEKEFTNNIVTFATWPEIKAEQPLEQLPTLKTDEGVLCQSNVIARHLARKFGLIGSGSWDETLNDLVLEVTKDFYEEAVLEKVYPWKLFKSKPEPENSEKVVEEAKALILKDLAYIQSIADRKEKKFILGDTIQLGDVWLYSVLESSKLAFSDMMTITPWVAKFTKNFESDERIKKYLAGRPKSAFGI